MKKFSTILISMGLSVMLSTCGRYKPELSAPLFKNMGTYHVSVSTRSRYASKFFNQGLIWANAFNHMEAARSFREAIRLDSGIVMGYWGIAYVLGPNYNTASNLGDETEIRDAIQKAEHFEKESSQSWERALVGSIKVRFPEGSHQSDDQAYMEALKQAYEDFPDNDLIATLYAESMMNLHAWDLYTRKGGEPKPWTPEIVSVLEKALEINHNNPLANHLYIHAMEAAPDVERALVCAERLKTLVPGAGHLVHMPSHVYINTGNYHEGTIANENAVKADSIYIAESSAQGIYPQLYYPHNYHFMTATAALEGRGAKAIEAAFKMSEIIEKNYLSQPGYETTQHYITIPYNVLVKFAQWEKIIALPAPVNLPYPKAIWHYARGMAFANLNELENAREELQELNSLASSDSLKQILIWEINSASDIAHIALNVLSGEIQRVEGNLAAASEFFRKGIVIEDSLNYNEPPDWFFSVRHLLGDVLLDMSQPLEAQKVYIEDLMNFPKNGFALNGLYYSLKMQHMDVEAEQIRKQFDDAWQYADCKLRYSRIDPDQRTDLVVKIDKDSPQNLLYLTAAFCGVKKN